MTTAPLTNTAGPSSDRTGVDDCGHTVRRHPWRGALPKEATARPRPLDATPSLAGVSSLTVAEARVLPLLATYLSLPEIADRLGVSRNTVKTHVMAIYGKLQVSSRSDAMQRAVELGLVQPLPLPAADGRRQEG